MATWETKGRDKTGKRKNGEERERGETRAGPEVERKGEGILWENEETSISQSKRDRLVLMFYRVYHIWVFYI